MNSGEIKKDSNISTIKVKKSNTIDMDNVTSPNIKYFTEKKVRKLPSIEAINNSVKSIITKLKQKSLQKQQTLINAVSSPKYAVYKIYAQQSHANIS
jgi:hypothetical protein